MTTARFEMRDGVGMLILTDGNHVVELTPDDARSAFDLWDSHMRPVWDRERAEREQAERDAMNERYRQCEVRKDFGGPDGYETWAIQMHPDFPDRPISAWPVSYGDRETSPIGVGRAMKDARPFQVEYRAHSWGGNSYMTDWGTARYLTIESAIKAAIRNRPAVLLEYEASKRRNAAKAA